MPSATLLKRGAKGLAVTQAQQALNHHFGGRLPAIQPDGTFGSITEARVHEFQRRNGLVPTDGIIGPITREKLFAIGVARILFRFTRIKQEAFKGQTGRASNSAFDKVKNTFGLQPNLVGDGPAPKPPESRVVVVDWGQSFTFQPLAKPSEEEHLLKTELKLALKNNGQDEGIIGTLKLELPPGLPLLLPNWQLKAEMESPVTELKILGPLEANIFTTQSVQLSPFQLAAGAGVKLGVKILGGRLQLFAQGDLKMEYTPETREGEVTPSASGAVEFQF